METDCITFEALGELSPVIQESEIIAVVPSDYILSGSYHIKVYIKGGGKIIVEFKEKKERNSAMEKLKWKMPFMGGGAISVL